MEKVFQLIFCLTVLSAAFGPGDKKKQGEEAALAVRTKVNEYVARHRYNRSAESVQVSRPLAAQEAAAMEFGVPEWVLNATWRVESDGLAGGQGDSANWHRAAELIQPGSACAAKKGLEWCRKQFRSLQAICAQDYADGERVCDPETVRTSWALAMGPMQILPTNIVSLEGGYAAWTTNAVEFDGDGVVNPMALPDGMAMAAKLLRNFHARGAYQDTVAGWLAASDDYLGKASERRRERMIAFAAEWCASHDCGTHHEEIASR